jgi:hypothetical protein
VYVLKGDKKEVLPPAAKAVAKSQRMLEFPVSSGNAHRSAAATVLYFVQCCGSVPVFIFSDLDPTKLFPLFGFGF